VASIERRRTTWRVKWYEDGERQAETFTDEADAVRFRGKVEDGGNRWPDGWVRGVGPAETYTDNETTLAQWCLQFIDSDLLDANDDTRKKYRAHVRDHIAPYPIGAIPLGKLRRDDLLAWVRTLAEYRAYKTVKNIRGEVSSALTAAVKLGKIKQSPMFAVKIPATAAPKRDAVFLDEDEVADLLLCIPSNHKLLVRTLAETGIRWGEARALKVSSIVRSNRRGTYVLTVWEARKASGQIGTTKTLSSKRTIGVGTELGALLMELAKGRHPSAPLFDNIPTDGTFWRQVWDPAVIEAGLEAKRPRIHDLRHSHFSQLLADGATLFSVSKRAGHKTLAITADIYGHLHADDDDVMAILNRKRDGKPDLRAV
jgi:integrase